MSLRDRRLLSSKTAEAKAEAEKRVSEGKDPVTGKREGGKPAPCPRCEVGPSAPASGRKGGGGMGEKGGAA
jgi:hypothetical protein